MQYKEAALFLDSKHTSVALRLHTVPHSREHTLGGVAQLRQHCSRSHGIVLQSWALANMSCTHRHKNGRRQETNYKALYALHSIAIQNPTNQNEHKNPQPERPDSRSNSIGTIAVLRSAAVDSRMRWSAKEAVPDTHAFTCEFCACGIDKAHTTATRWFNTGIK